MVVHSPGMYRRLFHSIQVPVILRIKKTPNQPLSGMYCMSPYLAAHTVAWIRRKCPVRASFCQDGLTADPFLRGRPNLINRTVEFPIQGFILFFTENEETPTQTGDYPLFDRCFRIGCLLALFKKWNLRFQKGKLSGILDFELAHWDHRVGDFALSWRGKYDEVVYGYDEVSPLEPEEWELLTTMWRRDSLRVHEGTWRKVLVTTAGSSRNCWSAHHWWDRMLSHFFKYSSEWIACKITCRYRQHGEPYHK